MPERKALVTYNPANRRTNTIGIIVPDLDSYFITSAVKGIGKIATECGYELVITNSQGKMAREVQNTLLLSDRRVDGVIASLSTDTKSLGHFSIFTGKGIPVVFFDSVMKSVPCDAVVIDNVRCGFLATQHLIRQGCKRIAIVTSNPSGNFFAQRYQGYREALDKYAIPFTGEFLIHGDSENGDGSDAAGRIINMRSMPDGLFITNDVAAAECMRSLKEHGIRVPEDIAVVGFNNDPVARLICPALTTIDYSGFEMGKAAAMRLFRHLPGRRSPVKAGTSFVPAKLIVRDSSVRRQAIQAIDHLS